MRTINGGSRYGPVYFIGKENYIRKKAFSWLTICLRLERNLRAKLQNVTWLVMMDETYTIHYRRIHNGSNYVKLS